VPRRLSFILLLGFFSIDHATANIASKRSSRTGMQSSFNALMYASIASRILAIASSLVFPLLMQPGRLGTSAT